MEDRNQRIIEEIKSGNDGVLSDGMTYIFRSEDTQFQTQLFEACSGYVKTVTEHLREVTNQCLKKETAYRTGIREILDRAIFFVKVKRRDDSNQPIIDVVVQIKDPAIRRIEAAKLIPTGVKGEYLAALKGVYYISEYGWFMGYFMKSDISFKVDPGSIIIREKFRFKEETP